MNSANKQQQPMKPRTETKAVATGRKAGSFPTGTMGKPFEVGKGGCETGKWCSFSHLETALTRLFPHDSTQVVDFPRMAMVRLFSDGARIGFSSQAELGTNIGEAEII
jgi:hypothetical protein